MKQLMLLTAALVLLVATTGCTTVQGTTTHACDLTRQSLNTGYGHSQDAALSLGDADAKWVVVRDPDPATAEPRLATAVALGGWAAAQPDSQWIGPYPEGTTTAGTVATTEGDEVYSYLYCFCPCDESGDGITTIQGSLRADNKATAYLNDVEILAQTATDTWMPSRDPVPFSATDAQVRPGINCLRVDLTNETGGPSGLYVQGTITRLSCCQGRTSRPNPDPAVGDPLAEPMFQQ